jgi:EAL domain-containing protein (putative c-di-GMP-specific phosphodiesterase class I)
VLPEDTSSRDQWREAAEEMGWTAREHVEVGGVEFGCIRVRLGAERRWSTATEVVGFLRTIFEDDECQKARGTILEPETSLESAFQDLFHADRLDQWFDDTSPLVGVLEHGRLETWYQPIFDLGAEQPWGYECLMRARDEDGELISPLTLIDWADREQLQFMLDREARETHLRHAWERVGGDAYVLINFMPTAIYEPKYCLRTTVQIADELGVEPSQVVFEVVESESLDDRDHLIDILDEYRDTGFKVGLDDLGSGYASLGMLADLSPDLIKIDREIVSNVDRSERHRQICESLAGFANDDGTRVLAEGVETEQQFEVMSDFGIELFQGYLFERPAPEPPETFDWSP